MSLRTLLAVLPTVAALASRSAAAADPADPFMGDWQGTAKSAEGTGVPIAAQVIAQPAGLYRVNLIADFAKRVRPLAVLEGKAEGGKLAVAQVPGSGNPANNWTGTIDGAVFAGRVQGAQNGTFELKKVERLSPTLGAKPPAGAVVLFDGTSLDAWQKAGGGAAGWKLADGVMEVAGGSIITKQKFGDCRFHVEFRLPFLREQQGQARGNSGVYAQGRYEVQVLDSYGLEGANNECGGIYSVAAPRVNMCAPPLQWQTYDITFKAPRFDGAGKKTASARMTVKHNGETIQDDVEVPHPTTAAMSGDEVPADGLYLQDHGCAVQYRNVWAVEEK